MPDTDYWYLTYFFFCPLGRNVEKYNEAGRKTPAIYYIDRKFVNEKRYSTKKFKNRRKNDLALLKEKI